MKVVKKAVIAIVTITRLGSYVIGLDILFDHCRCLIFLPCSLTRGGGKLTPNFLIPNLGGSYISNLSLKICLESLKKFLWWVVGGGGVLM